MQRCQKSLKASSSISIAKKGLVNTVEWQLGLDREMSRTDMVLSCNTGYDCVVGQCPTSWAMALHGKTGYLPAAPEIGYLRTP